MRGTRDRTRCLGFLIAYIPSALDLGWSLANKSVCSFQNQPLIQ